MGGKVHLKLNTGERERESRRRTHTTDTAHSSLSLSTLLFVVGVCVVLLCFRVVFCLQSYSIKEDERRERIMTFNQLAIKEREASFFARRLIFFFCHIQ